MKKRRSKHAQRLGFNLFHEPRMKLDFGPPKGGGFGGLFKAPKGNNWLNIKPPGLSFAPPKGNLSLGMPSGSIFGQSKSRKTRRVRMRRATSGKGINYEKINKVGSSVAGALSKLPGMLKSKKKVEAEEHEKREEAESGYHKLTKQEMEKR